MIAASPKIATLPVVPFAQGRPEIDLGMGIFQSIAVIRRPERQVHA